MSPEILEKHIRLYLNEQPPEYPEVHFLWQGGEPTLMGIDFFQRAVNIQQHYAKHEIKISNSLQTNAVMASFWNITGIYTAVIILLMLTTS
jgi:uncharacterized protein